MPVIAVLGDSLSVAGYGIKHASDTWPMLLQGMLGADYTVTVHAQGGLRASVCEGKLRPMYFGCTHHLSTALNVEVDAYVVCLGTNDVLHSNCCGQSLEEGLRRIILLVRHGAKAVFGNTPRIYIVEPPNLTANKRAETRRHEMLVPALKSVAQRTGVTVLPLRRPLSAREKHEDGVHLKPAGARALASGVHAAWREVRRVKRVAKGVRKDSIMQPAAKRKATSATRTLGKTGFLAMPRSDLRAWAKTNRVPFKGGGTKEAEQRSILGKLGVQWLL